MAEAVEVDTYREYGVGKERGEFKLYTYVEDDGGFLPPDDIGELLNTIENMDLDGYLNDYERGQVFAITELLSTPFALIHQRIKTLLEDVHEMGMEEVLADEMDDDDDDNGDYPQSVCPIPQEEKLTNDESEGDNDMSRRSKRRKRMMLQQQYTEVSVDNDNTESTIPMTELELNAWYRSANGVVIQNWSNLTTGVKYARYIDFLNEKNRLERDITDEEMLTELAGDDDDDDYPEQSD